MSQSSAMNRMFEGPMIHPPQSTHRFNSYEELAQHEDQKIQSKIKKYVDLRKCSRLYVPVKHEKIYKLILVAIARESSSKRSYSLEELLKYGLDLNVFIEDDVLGGEKKDTIMGYLISTQYAKGLQLCIKYGLSVEITPDNKKPLIMALKKQLLPYPKPTTEAIKILLDAGANPDTPDNKGRTARTFLKKFTNQTFIDECELLFEQAQLKNKLK